MTIVLGLVVTLGCMLGGFVVMGGKIGVYGNLPNT